MDFHSVYVLLIEACIADAEMTIRELKRHHLANNVIHLQDGEEALDFLFATGKFAGRGENYTLPKIILLDIQLPKVNGMDVLKKIKADNRINGTPVILLTSSGLDPDLHDCFELGASSYIVKPLNFERFTQAIQNLGFFWLLLNQAPSKQSCEGDSTPLNEYYKGV
jgi:two-component system response regulator